LGETDRAPTVDGCTFRRSFFGAESLSSPLAEGYGIDESGWGGQSGGDLYLGRVR
jgi:hypothetical protein